MSAESRVSSGGPPAADEHSSTVVTFAPGAAPEASTIVRSSGFDGPLGLLLALIEARELDVRSVRLGELASAYLDALAALPGDRLPHISAFIGVAAQLILIKSRAILPVPPLEVEPADFDDAPDPEAELRERLLVYGAYRRAAAWFSGRATSHRAFHREAAPPIVELASAPRNEPPLDPALLVASLAALVRIAPQPAAPPEVVARSVTLAERAAIIRQALEAAPVVVLQDLLRDVRDRVVVAVTFLALLEMAKRRELVIEQREPWGPIECRASA